VSEAETQAADAEEIASGLWHWAIHDERIDFTGDSYALAGEEGTVLIDPHALGEEALDRLRPVTATCLTAGSHQRSAWRYRRELGAPVYAPRLVHDVDEEPDVRYGDGDELPGGLRAHFTPGAGTTQHTLVREGDTTIAFCPDLLLREPDDRLGLVADEYLHDPDEARRSVEKLLALDFDLLCLSHGGPVLADAKAAVRRALER
jgi:hypothetical protein